MTQAQDDERLTTAMLWNEELADAKAEIERLQSYIRVLIDEDRAAAEIERLRALLRPFVDMVAEPEDFAAARRALEGKE